jgi:hypothetical protein
MENAFPLRMSYILLLPPAPASCLEDLKDPAQGIKAGFDRFH